jgi:hypothetical protein
MFQECFPGCCSLPSKFTSRCTGSMLRLGKVVHAEARQGSWSRTSFQGELMVSDSAQVCSRGFLATFRVRSLVGFFWLPRSLVIVVMMCWLAKLRSLCSLGLVETDLSRARETQVSPRVGWKQPCFCDLPWHAGAELCGSLLLSTSLNADMNICRPHSGHAHCLGLCTGLSLKALAPVGLQWEWLRWLPGSPRCASSTSGYDLSALTGNAELALWLPGLRCHCGLMWRCDGLTSLAAVLRSPVTVGDHYDLRVTMSRCLGPL